MAANSASYPLSRGFAASARLNLQHFLHKKDLGYLVHPSIPLNAEDLHVADVGTGTGIWLVDLSDELPRSAKLDGFDISDLQYPHSAWNPPNVNLGIYDIFTEVPEKLRGKYNLVNIRFFVCVVRNNDVSQILRNVMALLKPGGYLQWTEYDAFEPANEVAPGVPVGPWEAVLKEVEVQTNSDSSRFTWCRDLPANLERVGFTDVRRERKQARQATWASWQQSNLMVAEEMSYSIPGGDKIRDLVHRNYAETPKGVFWSRPHLIFLARKPL